MSAVLIYAPGLLPDALESTLLGGDDVERHVVANVGEVITTAGAVRPELVMLDKDVPQALELVEILRSQAETRHASIVALAKGAVDALEVRLLGAGVNAILRYPAGPAWDERLARLIEIPVRRPAQVPIEIAFTMETGAASRVTGTTANVSLKGVLVECLERLPLDGPLGLRFSLPRADRGVQARGRVVRRDALGRYGIRFDDLDAEAREAIRSFVG